MKKVYTLHGEAWIDLNEIIGIMPKVSRDTMPYILLRCGEKIFFDEYHLKKLKEDIAKL